MKSNVSPIGDKTVARARDLFARVDKLGGNISAEETVRKATQNGAVTSEDFARAFEQAGLRPETAKALGGAVEAHFRLAALEKAVQATTEASKPANECQTKGLNIMKQLIKENFRWVVLSAAIVIAMSIHACSTHYAPMSGGRVLNRWNGHVTGGPQI